MIMIDLANNISTFILTVASLFVMVIAFVGWFIRLESKVNYLEKDHESQISSQAEKDSVVWDKIDAMQTSMNAVLQAIGRVEGKVEAGIGKSHRQ